MYLLCILMSERVELLKLRAVMLQPRSADALEWQMRWEEVGERPWHLHHQVDMHFMCCCCCCCCYCCLWSLGPAVTLHAHMQANNTIEQSQDASRYTVSTHSPVHSLSLILASLLSPICAHAH